MPEKQGSAKNPLDNLFNLTPEEMKKYESQSDSKTDFTGVDKGIADARSIPERYRKGKASIASSLGLGNETQWSAFNLPKNMERQAYLDQTGFEVFENSLRGFGNQFAAGGLKALASWDLKGMYDMAAGNTEKNYGNWLNDVSDKILDYNNSTRPIYQDGDNMWNSSYWANQFQNLGLSVGIISESIGEQALLGYLTGGTGNSGALGTKANLLRSLGKQFTFGSMKGIQESYTNALEVQGNVYQKYLDLGYDDVTAQQKAAEAATFSFRAESAPLMLLNGLQYAATFGAGSKLSSAFNKGGGLNSGYSGAVESIMDKVLPNVNNKFARKAINLGANSLAESAEEGIQQGINSYAEYKTLASTGDAKDQYDLFTTELRDNMIGGALGGTAFSTFGSVIRPYIKNSQAKQYEYLHDQFLNEAPQRVSRNLQDKQQNENAYNEALDKYSKSPTQANKLQLQKTRKDYEASQRNSNLGNTLNSLYLDYITGNTTAFESNIEQMQNTLDAVNNNDIAKLAEFGLVDESGKEKFDGSFEMVKNTFPKNIEDSKQIKVMLDNNLTNITSDFESAWDITKTQFQNKEALSSINEGNLELQNLYDSDTQYNMLSEEGKSRFRLEQEKNALQFINSVTPLSEANEARLEEMQDYLKSIAPYSSTDRPIRDTISLNKYDKILYNNILLTEDIQNNNKELKELQNPNTINKKIQERRKKEIDRKIESVTPDNKEELVMELQESGDLNEDTNAAIETQASRNEEPQEMTTSDNVLQQLDNVVTLGNLFSDEEFEMAQVPLTTADDLEAFNMQPYVYDKGNQEHETMVNRYANAISSIYENMNRDYNHATTPKDMFGLFVDKLGVTKAYKQSNFFKEGWKKAGLPMTGLNDIMGNFSALDEFEVESPTMEDLTQQDIQTEIAIKEVEPVSHYNTNNEKVIYLGNKIAAAINKVPFLGIEYNEVRDPLTGTVRYEDKGTGLNLKGGANLNVILDYNEFVPGSTFEAVVDESWTSAGVVRGSQEWIDRVPIKMIYKGEDVGYAVHEVNWWNTNNVADFMRSNTLSEEAAQLRQAEVITEGRALTRRVRQAVINNGGSLTMKVTNKYVGVTNTNSNNELKSVKDSNPMATMAFAMNNTLYTGNNQPFRGIISNIDSVKFTGSTIYMISRIGITKDELGNNQPLYVANQVITNHNQDSLNDIFDSYLKIFDSVRAVNKNTTVNDITVEMADKILDRVSNITGISKRQLVQVQGSQYTGLDIIKGLYPEESRNNPGELFTTLVKTSIGKNIPIINDDGSVTSIPYDDYVKENTYTHHSFYPITTRDGRTKFIQDVQPRIEFEPVLNKPEVVLSEQEIKSRESNIEFSDTVTTINDNPDLTQEEKDRAIETHKERLNAPEKITEITSLQRRRVIEYLYNRVLNDIARIEGFTTGDVMRAIKNSYENHLSQLKGTPEYDYLVDNKDSILGLGIYSADFNTVKNNIESFLSQEINEEDEIDVDNQGVYEKTQGKSSYETNVKTSLSTKTKMYFAGIAIQSKEKTITEEFAGLPSYYPIDDVFEGLQQMLVNIPNDNLSFSQKISEQIKINPREFGFLQAVLDTFNDPSTPLDVKNQLLYRLNQTKVEMYFGMYSKSKNGTYKLQSLLSNSRDPNILLGRTYTQNFKQSPMISHRRDGYTLNMARANQVLEQFNSWKKENTITNVSDTELVEWLGEFGISIQEETAKQLRLNEVQGMLNPNGSVIGRLGANLTEAIKRQTESKDPNFRLLYDSTGGKVDNSFFILRKDNSNFLSDLIRLEIENTFNAGRSMYIAGKTINSYSQPNSTSEQLRKIKNTEDTKMRDDLLSSPFSKNSVYLDIIGNNERALKALNLSYISLESIKQRRQKVYQDAGITDLSPQDYDLALLAQFQSEGATFYNNRNTYKGFVVREAKLSSPTLSDSSQLFLLNSPVFHLTNLNFTDDSSFQINEDVLDLMYSQIVEPDLLRMEEFLRVGKSTNIVGQDVGSQIFTVVPELNTIETGEGILLKVLHQGIKQGLPAKELMEPFKMDVLEILKTKLDENINAKINKVNGKYSGTWYENGFIDDKGNIAFMDNKYMERTGGRDGYGKMKIAAYDYVVNYMIAQAQWQMLFAGDFSNYYNEKHKFAITKDGMVDVLNLTKLAPGVELSKGLAMEYARINEVAKVNLSKRLKELLSPGNRIANSFEGNESKYIQLMIDDVEDSSNTLSEIIELWYPSEFKEHKDKIDELSKVEKEYRQFQKNSPRYSGKIYNSLNDSFTKKIKSVRESLAELFPEVQAYMKITATDAQEYTTWKEHLHILLNQGIVNKETFQGLYGKLESQSKNGYNQENELSEAEKKVIFQPIKPLHAGIYFEDIVGDDGVTKFKNQKYVYVKTSSFPLLPQMVKNSKLDNVRKNMERLEEVQNMKVRASYQSGNKVGAIKNVIPFDRLTTEVSEDLLQEMINSSTVLERGNFSIQQDKPFKTDKNIKAKKRDEVNRGTQFEDIILGNGINKETRQIFPNRFSQDLLTRLGITPSEDNNISGIDLYTIYNEIYREEQQVIKRQLYNSLGLDKNGEWSDSIQSLEEIKKALDKQLDNQQDKDILNLIYIVEEQDSTGRLVNKYYTKQEVDELGLEPTRAEFNLPIWITPNSQKFESVLNAVVANKAIRLKLPGFSSPVASEQGFSYVSEENYTNGGIIYTDKYNPVEGLKATHFEDGSLQYAQVLVASKFRNREGKLLELPTKNVNGKVLLDTDRIDSDLLSMFSFRIPTSSHQSGAIIEIVGFLPHEQGDLMIVPKDHTTQIGEDYDIDTRYVYTLNTIQDEDGKIRALNYDDIPMTTPERLEKIDQEYRNYKQQLVDEYFTDKQSLWYNNREKIIQLAFAENELEQLDSFDPRVNKFFDNLLQLNSEEERLELQAEIDYLQSNIIDKSTLKSEQDKLKVQLDDYLKRLKQAFKNEKSQAYTNYVNQTKIDKARRLVLENQIVNVFKSIYTSNSPDIQKMISATLSTDFAENTANLINAANNVGKKAPMLYEDTHQKEVLKLGASGKLGIGVHSNWVVLNSLFQQMETKPYIIRGVNEKTGDNIPFEMIFGNFTSKGQLGEVNGLNPERNINRYNGFVPMKLAEGNMINQNCSTDNQKLQIMGKRNENKYTINVFALMYNLGMISDKLDDGTIVGYPDLFISQPIIKRYVELKEKMGSITSEFNSDTEKVIKEQLIAEFGTNVQWANYKDEEGAETEIVGTMDKDVMERVSKDLTAQTLFDSINGNTNNETQWAVYEKFTDLQVQSNNINKVQQLVNIEGGGLGVSYFDVIVKKNNLINYVFPENGLNIVNVNTMFGQPTVLQNIDVNFNSKSKVLEDSGYIMISQNDALTYYIKPTTPQSHKIVNSIATAYNLWKNVFPFENTAIEDQINTILTISNKDGNTNSGLDLKYKVLNSLKDYIYSWNNIGRGTSNNLFSDNMTMERERLFSENGLASYLNLLKKDNNKIFKEAFFREIEIDLGDNDTASIIKYSINDKSNFNKNEVYKVLLDMSTSQEPLPDFYGDNKYTYEKLIKDLLKYSLLANQGNGAIGFRQYMPVQVLSRYNVTDNLRTHTGIGRDLSQNLLLNGNFKALMNVLRTNKIEDGVVNFNVVNSNEQQKSILLSQVKGLVDRINSTYGSVIKLNVFSGESDNLIGNLQIDISVQDRFRSTFVKQFYQHNPGEAVKLNWNRKKEWMTPDTMNIKLENLTHFTNKPMNFGDKTLDNEFVTIRDSANSRFLLFQQIQPGVYERISTLGEFGVNEYAPFEYDTKSIFNDNNVSGNTKNLVSPVTKAPITQTSYEQRIDKLTMTPLNSLVNEVAVSKSKFAEVAKLLEGFVEATPINVQSLDLGNGQRANGGYVEKAENETVYNSKVLGTLRRGEIYLDTELVRDASSEDLTYTLLEEVVHSLTVEEVSKYINTNDTNFNELGELSVIWREGESYLSAPIYITKLLSLYEDAIKYTVNNITTDNITKNMLIDQYNNSTVVNGKINRLINLKEFIAGVTTDEIFRKEMSAVPVTGNKDFLSKFVDVIRAILRKLSVSASKDVKDNVSEHGFDAVMSLLQARNEQKTVDNISRGSAKIDGVVEDLLFDEGEFSDNSELNQQPSTIINVLLQNNLITKNCL